MEKDRRIKILSIVALVLAITGMSLGFAAFTSTLTISSSATVTPNSDDFNIKIYGFIGNPDDIWKEDISLENLFIEGNTSTTTSTFCSNFDITAGTNAIIDNSTLSISNLKTNFNSTNDEQGVYVFKISNEGKYTAYLEQESMSEITGICTAETGTTASYVEETCQNALLITTFLDNEYNVANKIEPGNSIYLYIILQYDISEENVEADGPFSVEFPTLELNFTTAPIN